MGRGLASREVESVKWGGERGKIHELRPGPVGRDDSMESQLGTQMSRPEHEPPAGAVKLPVQAVLGPGLPSAGRSKTKRPSEGTLWRTRPHELSLCSPLRHMHPR